MPLYVNPNSHTVYLVGIDGQTIKINSGQRLILPEYFDRYRAKGYIRRAEEISIQPTQHKRITSSQSRQQVNKPPPPPPRSYRSTNIQHERPAPRARHIIKNKQSIGQKKEQSIPDKPRKIVGQQINDDATKLLKSILDTNIYPISNNIGIGILSYNRANSLKRLIDSIKRYTDLRRTTIFISDDCSIDLATIAYIDSLSANDFIVLRNNERIGVAGNTNRLMRCLARFKTCIILNDDVEILKNGWEYFYQHALDLGAIKHFCMRQPGVYGAKIGDHADYGGLNMTRVADKPHGAVLAYAQEVVQKIGYFDEQFGLYGMEHVDWSNRVPYAGLQPGGYFDMTESDIFFKIHNEKSAVDNRAHHLDEARKLINKLNPTRGYVAPSPRSAVPIISCIIPCRDHERNGGIKTVISNIMAQRFPAIEIIIAENDTTKKVDSLHHKYILIQSNGRPFNKAITFNVGVANASSPFLVLHDADIIVPTNYISILYDTLKLNDACHLGKSVLYLTNGHSSVINSTGIVDKDVVCQSAVSYFEGGSLGCHKSTYWLVGGFNEDFWGWGCFGPDNFVLTEDGYKKICNVDVYDKLYTHNNNFKPIKLLPHHHNGEVYDIFVPGRLPIKAVTPEHPFLVRRDSNNIWVEANNLKLGDIVASTDFMPEFVPPYDFDDILNNDKSLNHFNINKYIDEFCYLIGIYLSEGVIQTPNRFRTTFLYLNENEDFIVNYVRELVGRINQNINISSHYVKNSCRYVGIFNSLLAKLIYAICGKHTAKFKILSSKFIDTLSNNNIAHLLGGLCDGDANHNKGSEKRLVYHTSSINLAMITSGLMRRLGIAHSFGKRKILRREFPDGSASESISYDLCVNREFEHLIRSIYPRPPVFGSSSMGRTKFGTIYDIRRYYYDGLVYNFEVEDDHSYIVNGLIVHNCEDNEFYERLINNCNFKDDRKIDFVHMWHGRSSNWQDEHRHNKEINKALQSIPMAQRIQDRYSALRNTGYGEYLDKALKGML